MTASDSRQIQRPQPGRGRRQTRPCPQHEPNSIIISGSLLGENQRNGPKADIFVPPHHHYTETLLSSVPEMDPTGSTGYWKTGQPSHSAGLDEIDALRRHFRAKGMLKPTAGAPNADCFSCGSGIEIARREGGRSAVTCLTDIHPLRPLPRFEKSPGARTRHRGQRGGRLQRSGAGRNARWTCSRGLCGVVAPPGGTQVAGGAASHQRQALSPGSSGASRSSRRMNGPGVKDAPGPSRFNLVGPALMRREIGHRTPVAPSRS